MDFKISENIDELYNAGFGVKQQDHLLLNIYEMLHLVRLKKIKGDEQQILGFARDKDKHFDRNFKLFTFFLKSGRMILASPKYDSSFLIYELGIRRSEKHAKYMCFVFSKQDNINFDMIQEKIKIAGEQRKIPLFAIFDNATDKFYFLKLSHIDF